MTDTEPIKDDVARDASSDLTLRKVLMFLIFLMLPIIGMLVLLNVQKERDQPAGAGQSQSEVVQP